MLWKILTILLVLVTIAIIASFTFGGAIYIILILTLGAVFLRFSQWLQSVLKEIDQLLKLSI